MTIWALTLAFLAFVMLVVIPLVGALRFHPREARNVKYAERLSDGAIQQHVIAVAPAHPEIVRASRLDRHPFYTLPHMAIFAYAICVFRGADVTSNVQALSEGTRTTMAACFMLGSVMVLTASAMGMGVGWHRFAPRVHEHPTMDVLGDNIVLPYRIGMAGLFTTAVAAGIYAATSFQSTTGSLGGWLTASLAAACALTVALLWRRTITFDREDSILVREALARMEIESDAGS